MPFDVYDFRTDVRNIVVTPEIRGRFLRMEPGEVASRHSHDLGHEMFLILDGQCEFEIDGDRAVLGPGQACFARRDQLHQVRVIGDRPMTMYLSVTPHIDPTHTFWTADPQEGGQKRPPRYAGWRSRERDGIADPPESVAELVDRQVEAARQLAEIATRCASAQQRHGEELKLAALAGDSATARASLDALWSELFPLFRASSTLAEAWNDIALKVGAVSQE
ncbi:MAG: cupin domain-containing protein [Chloroflexota bacterium]